ncbi:SubName: Full=Uncharacterized protein {ECO:0000313/EMBL:CCA66547.1} [Serendipita indica DSM 11827]|uniref:NADH dehydrogenase [ubiquinone] 1 beta subcomplex subunit 9 n=1 Tax=Serendipita indica (strain DSM 11827) TaxID=1109443 RepID=G4T5J9_SERID|nr:SubName: Full=Uncharacterized protein {ECO:0000313/EMBL:CCA66547.1} [Serendipita indica DSM 11827]CCA66547.1 hypothetical protein PIIN_00231 [Serendipita indica DSM 11827]
MASATASRAFTDTHRLYVKSLYKRYLTNALNWAVQRDVWRAEALKIREEFEKHKNETDPKVVARILAEAEAKLAAKLHPDPYISAKFPGGTGWERNMPPPKNAFAHWVTEDHAHHEHHHHHAEAVESTDYLSPEQRADVGANFRLSRKARSALEELVQSANAEQAFAEALSTKQDGQMVWDRYRESLKARGIDISGLKEFSEYAEEEKRAVMEHWKGAYTDQINMQARGIIEEELSDRRDEKDGIWR